MTSTGGEEPGREAQRLEAARQGQAPWKLWGPYLSERQWGTVREDYSESGDSWHYLAGGKQSAVTYRVDHAPS